MDLFHSDNLNTQIPMDSGDCRYHASLKTTELAVVDPSLEIVVVDPSQVLVYVFCPTHYQQQVQYLEYQLINMIRLQQKAR